MDLRLKGKLALVSGSTAGIGLATVSALAHCGAMNAAVAANASRIGNGVLMALMLLGFETA